MKKTRLIRLVKATVVALLALCLAPARAWADVDGCVSRMLAAGDYAEGEAIVCYLGEGDLAAQADGPLAGAERLSEVTARQYAETTGEVIPAFDGLTAQAEGGPVAVLLVRSGGKTTEQLLTELLADPRVLSAEPNYLVEPASDEEEEAFVEGLSAVETNLPPEEHLEADGMRLVPGASETAGSTLVAQSERVASHDLTGYQWFGDGVDHMVPQILDATNPGVHAPSWNDPSTTNASGVVAIMDSGVDYTHPDLANVMYHFSPELQAELGCGEFGYAPRRDDPTDPMDYYNHGTHCAGIVAAEWNDFGVSGIANGVTLTAVSLAGLGRDISYSYDTIIRGYDFLVRAADAGVDIRAINRSLTVGMTTTALDVMVRAAGDRGMVTLEGVGNDNNDIDALRTDESMYQANPYILRVCAASLQDGCAVFSNYGTYTTDLFAPGSSILSTIPTGLEDKYRYFPQADANPLFLKTAFDDGSPDITATGVLQVDEVSTGGIGADGDDSSLKLHIRTKSDFGSHFFLDIPVGTVDDDDIQDVNVATYAPGFKSGYDTSIDIMLADGSYSDPWGQGVTSACYSVTGGWNQFGLHISDPDELEQELGRVVDAQGNTCIRVDICFDLAEEGKNTEAELEGELYIDQIAVGRRGNDAFMPYCYMNGTSMATPCATGCAAIVSSRIDASDPSERAAATVRALKGAVRQAEGYMGFCKQNGQIDLSLLGGVDGLVPVIESARTMGDTLVIDGSNFSTGGTLLVGGDEVETLTWSDGQVEATWPEGLSSGLVPIAIRTADGAETCKALILEAPKGTPNNALRYERDLAPIDSPSDGRKETTSPMSLVATEDGTLYAAVMDTDAEYGPMRKHTAHYLVRSDDQGASWTSVDLPQALKKVKLAVGGGKVFVWGATPPDDPTAVYEWHLYAMDVATGEFELLGSYEGHSEEVPREGSLAYVNGSLYLVDNRFPDADDDASPSHMRVRPFDADYRLTSEGMLLDHGYVSSGPCNPPLVTTVGNSIYVCGMNVTTRSSEPLDRLVGLERVDVAPDGSLSCTDLSSTLSGLTEVPDATGISIAATEDRVFLIGEDLGALLPSGAYHTDTFVLERGASSFEPYERTLSHALLWSTASVCADGWLYAFGISRDEESPMFGRATKLAEEGPEPGPAPDDPDKPEPDKPDAPDDPKKGDTPSRQDSSGRQSSGGAAKKGGTVTPGTGGAAARAAMGSSAASGAALAKTGDDLAGTAPLIALLAGVGVGLVLFGVRRKSM